MSDSRITCKLCGKKFATLTQSHMRRVHNISLEEYYEKYATPPQTDVSRLHEFMEQLQGWIMEDDNLEGIARNVVNSVLRDKKTKLTATILSVAALQLDRLGRLMTVIQRAEQEMAEEETLADMASNPFQLLQTYKAVTGEVKAILKMLSDAQELEIKKDSIGQAAEGYNTISEKPSQVQIFNTKIQSLGLQVPDQSGKREDIRQSVESLLNIIERVNDGGNFNGSSETDSVITVEPEAVEQPPSGAEESGDTPPEETETGTGA